LDLDKFSSKISILKFDSFITSYAKIHELLAIGYYPKNKVREKLSNTYLDRIIKTGCDWLITPQKIPKKNNTMTTVYLLHWKKIGTS
jgi:ABC-type enterochelin transport system ATPase subunit